MAVKGLITALKPSFLGKLLATVLGRMVITMAMIKVTVMIMVIIICVRIIIIYVIMIIVIVINHHNNYNNNYYYHCLYN